MSINFCFINFLIFCRDVDPPAGGELESQIYASRSSENRTHITHSRSVYTTIVRYSVNNKACTCLPAGRYYRCTTSRNVERARRIELPSFAWEAKILPLNHARILNNYYWPIVDPRRIELLPPQCECDIIPLYYGPIIIMD